MGYPSFFGNENIPAAPAYNGTEATMTQAQTTPRAFEALMAVIPGLQAEGFLQTFLSDVTIHDRKRIDAIGDSVPFVWIARETGTFFMDAQEYAAEHGSLRAASVDRLMHEVFTTEYARRYSDRYAVFRWDGQRLTRCYVPADALDALRGWL